MCACVCVRACPRARACMYTHLASAVEVCFQQSFSASWTHAGLMFAGLGCQRQRAQ